MPNVGSHRYVRLAGLTNGNIRTASFDGVDHVVVPVVALLGNCVVRPLGSSGPEFVPERELAAFPGGWNGRPIVPDHPNGGQASANDPITLERMCFGRMFNTTYKDGRLCTEAWLDPAKAEKVGPDAVRVVERARANEQVEVSVGCWISVDATPGTYEGQSYDVAWSDIVPDHLAMLPEDAQGACSVEMGCGSNRVMRAARPEKEVTVNLRSGWGALLRRFLPAEMRAAAEDLGPSDGDLRNALRKALHAVEPGFDWVMDVYPDSSTVIYMAMPEDRMLYLRRTYSKADDGTITLSDDRAEVEAKTVWEPTSKATTTPASEDTDAVGKAARAACASSTDSCPCSQGAGDAAKHSAGSEAAPTESQGDQMSKKDLVGRLIASERSPFTEADRVHLEAFPEDRLTAMAADLGNPNPSAPPTTPTTPSTPTTPTTPPSTPAPTTVVPEGMVAIPEAELASMRSMAAAYKAQEDAHRGVLITKIVGASSGAIKAEDLASDPTAKLESLAKAFGVDQPVRNFAGLGLPVENRSTEDEKVALNPPDGYNLAGLAAQREAKRLNGKGA